MLERYWPSYIFLAFPMLGLMAGMRAVMGQADGPNRSGTANDELAPRRDINEEELGLMQGEVFDGEDDQTVYSPRTSASGDVDESLPDKAA